MTKVFAVQAQGQDSWGGGNDSWETSSLHSSEEKAKTRAAERQLDLAIHYISHGNANDHRLGPDALLPLIEEGNEEIGAELRERMAKPGVDFFKELLSLANKASESGDYEYSMRRTRVKTLQVED